MAGGDDEHEGEEHHEGDEGTKKGNPAYAVVVRIKDFNGHEAHDHRVVEDVLDQCDAHNHQGRIFLFHVCFLFSPAKFLAGSKILTNNILISAKNLIFFLKY